MRLNRIVLACTAAVALLLCYLPARWAVAEFCAQKHTASTARIAVVIAPGNSSYWYGYARLLAMAGEEARARQALRSAVRANPRDSAALIELGLRAEADSDYRSAESLLLRAAGIDRTYDPRWALLNYYERSGDAGEFWKLAPDACRMAYRDPAELYRLFWTMTQDSRIILERGIPNEPGALRTYFTYLLHARRLAPAGAVAHRILSGTPGPADIPPLLSYCDRLLESGAGDDAVRLWNALCARRLASGPQLDSVRGPWMSNTLLEAPATSHAFDWHISRVDGISVVPDVASQAIRVAFSGDQPEECEVLWRYVVLAPGAEYRFSCEQRTASAVEGAGIHWRISAVNDSSAWDSPVAINEDWSRTEVPVRPRAPSTVSRIALRYRRPRGSQRFEGSIWMRAVSLGAAR